MNSDLRIGHPLLRRGDELVEAAWADALDAAATALSDARTGFGPESVGVIGGARLANEDAYAWAKLAKGVIGTDSVDCQLGDGLPAEVVLGLPKATIDDACSASAVVLLCGDIKEELPVLYLRLRGAALGDAKVPLIELSSRGTGLSKYASTVIGYRPGEAVGAVRELLDGDVDLGANPVVILGRPTLAESASSIVDAAGVLLSSVPGVRFLSGLRRGNVHGALDAGLAPGVLPGRVSLEDGRSWFTDGWGNAPASVGRDATAILQAAVAGELQAIVLLGADPLSDFPDSALAKAALERVPFVVAVDTFLHESVRLADVVLPAATFAERPGTTTNIEGRITKLGQKITAPEVAYPDWMIAVELAYRLGENLGFLSLEEIGAEMERLAPVYAGVTGSVLNDRAHRDGVVVPLSDADSARPETGIDASADPTATPGLLEAETQGPASEPEAATSTGADEPTDTEPEPETETGAETDPDATDPVLTPADGAEAPPDGAKRPELLTWSPRTEPGPAPKVDAYKLRVAAGRKLYDAGVMVTMAPSLAPLAAPPAIRIHPTELERLGVSSGGTVRVRSNKLTIDSIEVVADPYQPRGTAGLPFNVPGIDTGALLSADATVAEIAIETTGAG